MYLLSINKLNGKRFWDVHVRMNGHTYGRV